MFWFWGASGLMPAAMIWSLESRVASSCATPTLPEASRISVLPAPCVTVAVAPLGR